MNKTPKLRFKEFSGDWESKKLGSLLEFKNGINASKEQYGHGKKFINILDILSNDYITYENIIGKVDVDDATFDKYSVGYGDIVFQRSSETREEVGTANVYLDKDNKATFGGFIIRGKKIGEYDPIFMNKLLKSSTSRKEITTKSGGSTRYNVGQETLSEVSLLFPKLEEQEKIASFFSLIDYKISLQGEKVEALKDYKKGMMQKIFSRELRFKDDEGRDYPDWEEKKLDNVCNIKKGDQLNKDSLISDGEYYALNGGIDPSGYTDKYNTESDTISISEGGNSCGYVNYNFERFWSGGHCYTLEDISKCIDDKYLYQFLKYNQLKIMSLRVGSGLPNIQKKDLTIFKVDIPCIDEQLKISQLLFDIDRKTILEQEKIDSLNEYKKGLLQQMFV